MPPISSTDALTAAIRFGFAARGGDLAAIGRDPRGWVMGQLARPPAPLAGNLPNAATMVAAELEMRRQKDNLEAKRSFGERVKAVYLAEIDARTKAAVASETPLLERMTHFWSNHFTVSGLRPVVRGFSAAFEREAIRPYVLGRFSDMLVAVARHPAMLLYLDNAISIGPESTAGRLRGRGLNENLGRELLELHTLGVDGGYTQADVEALARILTGWSIARLNDPQPGSFRFAPQIHEPGPKTLLGKTYLDNGYGEGQSALLDLAHRPATAQHIARKLARHFIADNPPKDATERIARVFLASGGDLRQVMQAVIKEDAAWRAPFSKMRTPQEMVIAACRVSGFTPPPEMIVNTLHQLDQQPFFAPSPQGWPDVASEWVSPEAVLRRAQWCQAFAERMPEPPDPTEIAQAAFGEALPEETLQAIRRAPTRRVGLALLLASPQFQRR
ncbi:MAG TPA: DUF1800 domain-containing protein [Stellaceae bacterium]|nr:DUF1800 domain-containing protein [Stellaceae bacterium]